MEQIEHVIVLMLENRSFDHMLGFLQHPDPSFEGLRKLPEHPATMDARYAIYPGPDHSHAGVMLQILGHDHPPSYPDDHYEIKMNGFAASYDRRSPGRGYKALRCFDPEMVPVLSKLALEYAVCDHWFSSLPGETFPNRDYAHAGSSFGRVDITMLTDHRHELSVFRQLDAVDINYCIYHQGVAHSLIYYALATGRGQRGSHHQLLDDIANDRLAAYSFVEPDFGVPFGSGNSQHPSQARSREEFVDGEQLIANIYTALLDNPAVFEKTAFVITYDEHGGFYDHVPVAYMGLLDDPARMYKNGIYRFAFRISGPRVPAVVVSPWIPRGTVDHTVRDHSCIPETIRKRFFANVAYPLNTRAENTDLCGLFTLPAPRNDAPPVEPLTHARARELEEALAAPPDATDLVPQLDYSMQTFLGDVRFWLRDHGIHL